MIPFFKGAKLLIEIYLFDALSFTSRADKTVSNFQNISRVTS